MAPAWLAEARRLWWIWGLLEGPCGPTVCWCPGRCAGAEWSIRQRQRSASAQVSLSMGQGTSRERRAGGSQPYLPGTAHRIVTDKVKPQAEFPHCIIFVLTVPTPSPGITQE